MRIISGKYGGRRLVSFKADHIRPTTDRIKEVVFNKLQSDIEGARVLDLFSGTGNLALEALSRGAEVVHAVEKNLKSVQIIQKNFDLLQVPKDQYRIFKQDVFSFLKKEPTLAYDLLLVDPPFTESIGDEVLRAVGDSALCLQPFRLFIETGRHEKLQNSYKDLVLVEQKNYGDKHLSQYICKPPI